MGRPVARPLTMFEIGNSLREARARRKLSYDQVEAETKIRAKYIRCLEDEEFATLPSGTYVKGFLRTYAEYLGLDGQLYVDEYNSRYGDQHPDDLIFRRRERPAPRRRESSNTVLIALAAIVSVTVLFFVAWRYGDTGKKQPLELPSTKVETQPTRNALLDPEPVKDATPAPARKKKKPMVTLVMRATDQDSWLVVHQAGAKGQSVLRKTIPAGSFEGPVKWKQGFVILEAGVPSAVELKINGKPYVLPGAGPAWRVTADGVRSIPRP